ncbi:MAG: hypothetical protein WCA30_00630, partial [Dermatophilaceae bacterium]
MSAAISTAGFAALFFAFDEPGAGWPTLGLAVVYLIAWLAFRVGLLADRVVVAVALVSTMAAVNHIAVHVALGGFAHSGGYLF